MDNNINNWFDYYEKNYKNISKDEIKNEKMYMSSFDNHKILSKNVLALFIGPSGSGKTTSIIDFIMRTKDKSNYIPFFNVTYFTGSTSDENLIKLLKEIIPSTIVIDDANELPKINDYKNTVNNDKNNNDKFNNKLKNIIIFDDIGNLNKKQLDVISNWSSAGRKLFSHIFFLCQNLISVPLTIRRNINYFFVYRLREKSLLNKIIKSYNLYDIKKELMESYYKQSTQNKGDFFMIDLTDNSKYHLRHNFLKIWPIE